MGTGSALSAMRSLARQAARNNDRVTTHCLVASVLCMGIFLCFGALPHSSLLALHVLGIIGVFTLALAVMFALLRKVGLWWSIASALAVFAITGFGFF